MFYRDSSFFFCLLFFSLATLRARLAYQYFNDFYFGKNRDILTIFIFPISLHSNYNSALTMRLHNVSKQ